MYLKASARPSAVCISNFSRARPARPRKKGFRAVQQLAIRLWAMLLNILIWIKSFGNTQHLDSHAFRQHRANILFSGSHARCIRIKVQDNLALARLLVRDLTFDGLELFR